MVICQTLDEATKVANLMAIEVGAQIVAYQSGDDLPPHMTVDAEAVAAEQAKGDAIDGSIQSVSIGAAQPATVAQLKAMTLAQYSAWFDANFTTAATLIALLKRLTLIVIRRVL